MRKENSITDQAFNAINAVGVGNTFTVSDIYNKDMACYSIYGQRQRLYDILCMLNKTGLISRVKRGTYKVEFPIPDVLTYTDIESYNGYTLYYSFPHGARKRKQNPFDIDAYKASFSTPHSCGNVVPTQSKPSPETKTIYVVDMKTAAVTPTTVMHFDTSYLMMPNAFEDEDSADAFAEGIVVPECEEDFELENALEEIDNDIAETLFRESDPASDPEYKYSGPTEEQFEAAKADILKLDLSEDCEAEAPGPIENKTQVLGSYVALILSVGTKIWSIELDGDTVTATADEVESIFITVNASGTVYEFKTRKGDTFTKYDLGVKIFTDKKEAAAALVELV